MKDKVILYDNDEALIIEKHETNHINKNCKYFKFDGYLCGCSHKLDINDPIYNDMFEYTKWLFKRCAKNCKWKKEKKHGNKEK